MATYGSIATLKARLKALANQDVESASAEEALAIEALVDSNSIIKRTLISRGLTVSLIDTWSERDAFALDIAVYLYGQRQGWEKRTRDEADWVNKYNRIEELKDVPLLFDDGSVITTLTNDLSPGMSGFDLDSIYEA